MKRKTYLLLVIVIISLGLVIIAFPKVSGTTLSSKFQNYNFFESYRYIPKDNLTLLMIEKNQTEDQYSRTFFRHGEQKNLTNTNQILNLSFSQSTNVNSKYVISQFYFSFDQSINNTYQLNYSFELLNQSSIKRIRTLELELNSSQIIIDNDLVSFSNPINIEGIFHLRYYENWSYSQLELYQNETYLDTYRFEAYDLTDYNIDSIKLSNITLAKSNLLSNYSELIGMRNMYFNDNISQSSFLSFVKFYDSLLIHEDHIDFMVKIPIWVHWIFIACINLSAYFFANKFLENKLLKLRIYFYATLISMFLLLFAFNLISITLTGSKEGNLFWTLLVSFIFYVYLNAIGLNMGNMLKSNSRKIALLLVIIAFSLIGFGSIGFIIEFNFPFNLLFAYNIYSPNMVHGARFLTFNLHIWTLLYGLSYIIESEVDS